MFTLSALLVIVLYAVVVLCASITPSRSQLSLFERERRTRYGDTQAILANRRENTADDIVAVFRILGALALVVFILLALKTFGWLLGTVVAVVGVILYGTCAQLLPVQRFAHMLYTKIELPLIDFIEHYHGVFKFLRGIPLDTHSETLVDSREELTHIVSRLGDVVTGEEQIRLKHALEFDEKLVASFMTPRSVIESIEHDDLLGPLRLDELHKTGHSRFPVIDKDIDHVIGLLYVHNLLALHDKKTHKASSLMSTPVYYIKDTQTLRHALAAFLRTHHHLFIVVNEYRETVGLLTLEDVIEALLGRRIVDEFDTHEDLRTVAARNPRANNHPPKHTDV